jgi:ATP-dependent helicase/nuclease subunit A
MASDPVSPYVLMAESRMAPWILLPTLATPDPPWQVRWIDCAGERTAAQAGVDQVSAPRPPSDDSGDETDGLTPPLPRPLAPRPAFLYPHPDAIDLPSKLTATELKGRWQDREAEAEAEIYPRAKKPAIFPRPGFIDTDRPLTPAQRGTATHLVMQHIDFTRCGDLQGIEAEIARLAREARITAEAAQGVDAARIWAFFESPLGQRVLGATHLRREFKFSLLVPAEVFLGAGGGEEVLLQGVIDCCLEEPDGLVVLDFKTDYVPPGGLAAKAEEYAPQMAAYTYALENITGRPVKEVLLYFFASNETAALAL